MILNPSVCWPAADVDGDIEIRHVPAPRWNNALAWMIFIGGGENSWCWERGTPQLVRWQNPLQTDWNSPL